MEKIRPFLTAILLAILLSGCHIKDQGERTQESLPTEARRVLDTGFLLEGTDIEQPVDYGYLAPPEKASLAQHKFEGTLVLLGEAENGHVNYILGGENASQATSHLPEFEFRFIQTGDFLVPLQRGLIITEHPDWDYILEPGKVWSEPGDEGWSRASFPFFLVAKGGNSDLAGVMSFLYKDDAISKVYYQITQEITTSFRADLWGLLDAVYTPDQIPGGDGIRLAFETELGRRMPVVPIQELSSEYSAADFSAFVEKISPVDLTTWGLVIHNVHYRGSCPTRSGEYPFCEWVRMPSFSTAKTGFVGVALMRLEQQYGPGVTDLLIRDYLPETALSPGDWSEVTFNDVLDMATGNYSSSGFMVDEEQRIFRDFFGVSTYEEKIAAALNWPHSAPPGTTWVYRSSDTFILVAAMQNFLQQQQGPEADIFNYVVDEVYIPLGLGPGLFSTSRTSDDDWNGLPIGASGVWWIPDDVARLGDFLNNSAGLLENKQLLDPALLAAALQRDPDERGVKMPGGMYNNSFWSQSFGPAQGFDCQFSVPYMAGYTGNIIALMPNGITFYYFSDNRDFDWASAVLEANKIIPFCKTP